MIKLDIDNIDQENFLIREKVIEGRTCVLVNSKHIAPHWNAQNIIYRASMWDKETLLPVSLGFKKFFNWTERDDLIPPPSSTSNVRLIEKIDGSCLIFSKFQDKFIIRTRGSFSVFDLDNGHEVYQLLNKYPNITKRMMDGFSYLFEWVTPTQRIVIDYGNEPDLYLIGCIDHENYRMLEQAELNKLASHMNVPRPKYFQFNTLEEMLATTDALVGQEGICAYYNYGQSIKKVKSAWYLSLHRMKDKVHLITHVVDIFFIAGMPKYQEFYQYIHDTFDYEIAEMSKGNVSIICDAMKTVNKIIDGMHSFIDKIENLPTRKEQALKIIEAYGNTNRASFVFTLLDKQVLEPDQIKKLLYQVIYK